MYDNTEKEPVREKQGRSQLESSGYYQMDVAVPDDNIAIECKGVKNNIKRGIGQCIAYETDGWAAYVCVPDDYINEDMLRRCMRAQIGLIGVTTNSLDKDLTEFYEINVYLQNRNRIPTDYEASAVKRGSNSIDHTIQVNEILDMLQIEDMGDVKELREHLIKAQKSVSFGKGIKWKTRETVITDRSILPET
jgi:hypothetical protein